MHHPANALVAINDRPKISKRVTNMEDQRQIVLQRQFYLISQRDFLVLLRRMAVEIVQATFADGDDFTFRLISGGIAMGLVLGDTKKEGSLTRSFSEHVGGSLFGGRTQDGWFLSSDRHGSCRSVRPFFLLGQKAGAAPPTVTRHRLWSYSTRMKVGGATTEGSSISRPLGLYQRPQLHKRRLSRLRLVRVLTHAGPTIRPLRHKCHCPLTICRIRAHTNKT